MFNLIRLVLAGAIVAAIIGGLVLRMHGFNDRQVYEFQSAFALLGGILVLVLVYYNVIDTKKVMISGLIKAYSRAHLTRSSNGSLHICMTKEEYIRAISTSLFKR